MRGAPLQLVEGGLPRARGLDIEAERLQHVLEHLAYGGVVVHHQCPHAVEVDALITGAPAVLPGAFEGTGETEGAALSRCAACADGPAHQLHQQFADGQPQPRAAIFARSAAVRLGEGVEQGGHLFLLDADAGIGDRELQRAKPVRPLQLADADNDLSLLSELDGVLREVQQYLPDPQRIADQHARHVPLHREEDFDPFFPCLDADQIGKILQDVVQIERGLFDLQLAGLDLREVQDVVDDAKERVRGDLDLVEIVSLLGGQLRLQGKVAHTDDGVHRGANLVAHVGQEMAFGLAGRLGHLLGLDQLHLQPFAFPDLFLQRAVPQEGDQQQKTGRTARYRQRLPEPAPVQVLEADGEPFVLDGLFLLRSKGFDGLVEDVGQFCPLLAYGEREVVGEQGGGGDLEMGEPPLVHLVGGHRQVADIGIRGPVGERFQCLASGLLANQGKVWIGEGKKFHHGIIPFHQDAFSRQIFQAGDQCMLLAGQYHGGEAQIGDGEGEVLLQLRSFHCGGYCVDLAFFQRLDDAVRRDAELRFHIDSQFFGKYPHIVGTDAAELLFFPLDELDRGPGRVHSHSYPGVFRQPLPFFGRKGEAVA